MSHHHDRWDDYMLYSILSTQGSRGSNIGCSFFFLLIGAVCGILVIGSFCAMLTS